LVFRGITRKPFASLGFLYAQGKGLPLDYVSAYSWYTRAIAGGDSGALMLRNKLGQVMTQKQIQDAIASTPSQPPAPRPDASATHSVLSLF
jgi:TPR repeat protein